MIRIIKKIMERRERRKWEKWAEESTAFLNLMCDAIADGSFDENPERFGYVKVNNKVKEEE